MTFIALIIELDFRMTKKLKQRYHLTLIEKREIIAIWDEDLSLPGNTSYQSVANLVASKTGRILTKSTIMNIVKDRKKWHNKNMA